MVRKRQRRKEPARSFWDSFLFKFGSKVLLGLIIVAAFLTLLQCTIKKPEAPHWDTPLVVPVVNRTYPMEELIRKIDQEGIGIDSAGNVTYSINRDLDTVKLENHLLATSDLSYLVSERVGIVNLSPPDIDPVALSLSSISGLSSSLPGDSATVSQTSFDLYNDMPTITTFSQITVAQGSLEVTIDNALGVDLDTVTVEVYDVTYAATVATDTFSQGVPTGTVASLPISLNGKTMSNSLRVDTHCHTPGGTVDSASTRYISTELIFPDSIAVTSGTAAIPALSRSYTQRVALVETHRIDTATLSTGALNLLISNGTGLDATVSIILPDVQSPTGQALSVDRPVAAHQNSSLNLDIAGYRLIPGDRVQPQELEVSVLASVPGSDSQQVLISESDSFVVRADLSLLTFSSVTGVFDSATGQVADVGHDIDVPTGFDSIQFMSAILTLEVENAVDLPGAVDIQLRGNNGRTLNVSGDIAAAGLAAFAVTTLSDSSAADFLSPVPSHFDLSGSTVFGDGFYQGTIETDDYVLARVKILAPLEVIVNESRIETGIASEKIDQDDIDMVTEHFIEGSFNYNVINHLPLGAYINLFFGGDSTTVYTDPIKRFDSLHVVAAPVGADGVVVDTASTGYQQVFLDSVDVRRILQNDTLFVGQELILESSGGQVVRLTQADYITVVGHIEVIYRFDGEF